MPDGILKSGNGETLIHEDDLRWIATHWQSAAKLQDQHKRFSQAYLSFDGAGFSRGANDAILILWGALERLFSGKNQALAFRVSAAISSYLEPMGHKRHSLSLSTKKLYDNSSRVAYGGTRHEAGIGQ